MLGTGVRRPLGEGILAKLGSRPGWGRGEARLQCGAAFLSRGHGEGPAQPGLALVKFGVHAGGAHGASKGLGFRDPDLPSPGPWDILRLPSVHCVEALSPLSSGSQVHGSPQGGVQGHTSAPPRGPAETRGPGQPCGTPQLGSQSKEKVS